MWSGRFRQFYPLLDGFREPSTFVAIRRHLLVTPTVLALRRCSSSSAGSKRSRRVGLRWRLLVVGGFFVAAVGYDSWHGADLLFKREEQQKTARSKVRIGGSWDLTDHFGKPQSDTDFLGKWLMMYFGYCQCPDICPEEIEKIMSVVERLRNSRPNNEVVPVFVTVDPARDHVEDMAHYCADFPGLLGLTGTEEQINDVKKAYGVFGGISDLKDEEGNYIIDHTVITYLINPDGKFIDFYGRSRTADEVFRHVKFEMRQYNLMASEWFPQIRRAQLVPQHLLHRFAQIIFPIRWAYFWTTGRDLPYLPMDSRFIKPDLKSMDELNV